MRTTFRQLIMMALLATGIMCCKKDVGATENPTPEPAPEVAITGTSVPLGGNAFIVENAAAARETINGSGLSNWTDPQTVCAAYFRASKAGELKVALRLRVPAGSSQLKVLVNNTPFTVTVNNHDFKAIAAGSINIASAGYVTVKLQGLSKTGTTFAEVSDLVIYGTAATGIQFANDPANFYWSRRGPSVHLGYNAPANTDVEWFYNEVTVPVGEDKPGSFFMSNGFAHGYFGIQSKQDDRWVIFSVWDPAVGQGTTDVVGHGEAVTVQRFGGEGTGGQSYMVFDWKAGTTYRFLTQGRPDGAGNTLYSAWFFAPETGKWHYMATWKRPHTNVYLTGNHSFLENFYDYNGWMGRKANYNNQWACSKEGNWTAVTTARFTGDATATNNQRLDYAGGVDASGQFFLQNGGFFAQPVAVNQQFTRSSKSEQPTIDFTTLPKQ